MMKFLRLLILASVLTSQCIANVNPEKKEEPKPDYHPFYLWLEPYSEKNLKFFSNIKNMDLSKPVKGTDIFNSTKDYTQLNKTVIDNEEYFSTHTFINDKFLTLDRYSPKELPQINHGFPTYFEQTTNFSTSIININGVDVEIPHLSALVLTKDSNVVNYAIVINTYINTLKGTLSTLNKTSHIEYLTKRFNDLYGKHVMVPEYEPHGQSPLIYNKKIIDMGYKNGIPEYLTKNLANFVLIPYMDADSIPVIRGEFLQDLLSNFDGEISLIPSCCITNLCKNKDILSEILERDFLSGEGYQQFLEDNIRKSGTPPSPIEFFDFIEKVYNEHQKRYYISVAIHERHFKPAEYRYLKILRANNIIKLK